METRMRGEKKEPRRLARLRAGVLLFVLSLVVSAAAIGATDALRYTTVTVEVGGEEQQARIPAGFVLEVLTEELDEPRLLTFSSNGDLFAGSEDNTVYRIPPPYTDPEVLIRLDNYPHSVAFRDGEILIARTGGLYRAPYKSGQASISRNAVTRVLPLPGGGGHTSRTVRVGPDGRVYVSLGISGNCSDQYLGPSYPFQERRGGVFVLEADGENGEPHWKVFASGLRNPVGFDWHPVTGIAYASNNGPDHWGYELPPEAFSKLTPGSFHGMPWFQWDGDELRRDACIETEPPRPISDVSRPVATFPARCAPMGVAFVPEDALVPVLEGDAVVAIHGSWGTQPGGGYFGDPATRRSPSLMVVRFQDGEAKRVDDLVTGFQLSSGTRWARPVGVAVGPDGALYFSSDEANEALFRLRRVPAVEEGDGAREREP